jgi:hypothetical protein
MSSIGVASPVSAKPMTHAKRAMPVPPREVAEERAMSLARHIIGDAKAPYSAMPNELDVIDEALAERIEYVLIYGQPRLSTEDGDVIYEAKRLRAKHAGDSAAIGWAAGLVPCESGLTHAGKQYPAVPMVLRCGRSVVWESRPGMALRVTG